MIFSPAKNPVDVRREVVIHEIGRIDGGRGFQTRKYVFRIDGNTFYDQKNKIPMKILSIISSVT